ncbi:MAG: lactonase family protein [bacterium]|jgi:6-phosphogluconolactonase|nr:lactonase family protein [bacterium]
MKYHLYVANSSDEKILRYELDPETGDLTPVGEVAVEGGVGPLCTDPQQQYLYAGLRSTKKVSSFSIDPVSGALELINTVDLDGDPCYLSTDRTGRYLFSAYYGAGVIAVNALDSTGAVTTPHRQWIPTAAHAHCIHPDRSNQFVFVPHTMSPNAIFQFTFDETKGDLTANAIPRIKPPRGEGPRHYEFHPTRNVVYVSNENGNSVTVYDLDPNHGTLSRRQNLSTLPEDFSGKSTCAQIHIHPSGKFLYITNRGHNSIARFAVKPDGSLEELGQTPTEPIPRVFNIDPSGNFLFAAGQGSGKMESFRIDPVTGDLTSLKFYDVGEKPMWVMILKFGK